MHWVDIEHTQDAEVLEPLIARRTPKRAWPSSDERRTEGHHRDLRRMDGDVRAALGRANKVPARRTASPSRTLIADSKSGGPKQVWALVPGGNLVSLAFAGTVSEREDGPRGTVKEVRGAVRLVPEIQRAYDAASLVAAKRR